MLDGKRNDGAEAAVFTRGYLELTSPHRPMVASRTP